MTNEQLAGFIKDGGSDELIPLLWERVRRLLYSKADSEYRKRPEQFDRCGVTARDLKQVCYTDVFLKALEGYDAGKGLQFTTYLTYPFMRAVETVLGARGGRQNTRPLDNCISLDAPVNDDADGEPLTLADVLPDDSLEPLDDQITRADMKRIVRAAVRELDEPFCEYITRHYFGGESLNEIGRRHGITGERVRQQIAKGLRQLRRDPDISMLMIARRLDLVGNSVISHSFDRSEYYPGFETSPEKKAAQAEQARCPAIDYGARQALMYEAYYRYWRRKRREREAARLKSPAKRPAWVYVGAENEKTD